MCSQNQSLLCRFGFHRWTFEISQGSEELQATQEWYCPKCQIDRFDEAWLPTTRIDRWQEAIYTPFAKLHHRIQALLYRPPPTKYATTSQRSKPTTVVLPVRPEPATGTPMLMAFITVHNQTAETSTAKRSNDDRTREQRSTTTD